jgi:uncharacterized protein YneF (UPF0154 family)
MALDVLAIVIALVVGGAIGLLLSAARRQKQASQQLRFERQIARNATLQSASRAGPRQSRPTGPRDEGPAVP